MDRERTGIRIEHDSHHVIVTIICKDIVDGLEMYRTLCKQAKLDRRLTIALKPEIAPPREWNAATSEKKETP
jgi:hypothetical protein